LNRHFTIWTSEEQEELKTIFLERSLLFSVYQFAKNVGRSEIAISTRIIGMINPTDRLYQPEFANKVKKIFPNQSPGGTLDRILSKRKIFGV
tara:strand:+ start:176 stop:451 length:276 start_codon:yes stop_codon:yes gene_type:complete